MLRIWQLLATLVGVGAIAHVGVVGALTYVGLGWLGLIVAHQTFGRPIAQLGVRLMDAVSGVELEGDEDAGFQSISLLYQAITALKQDLCSRLAPIRA